MSEVQPEKIAGDLLSRLRSERVTYFPIRHHSPACAAHIEKWILQNKPEAVLVEGPSSFTSRIERLLDERCRSPVAFFTSFIDRKERLKALAEKSAAEAKVGEAEGEAAGEKPEQPDRAELPDSGPPRFAAYYPFCDFSPELVALRTGRIVGARLRFIDLEYGEMVLWQARSLFEQPREVVRVESLADDAHLAKSRYVKELASKLGCRDFDELWDHLFESGYQDLNTNDFMDRLAVYCAMARLDYSDGDLSSDATTAREACMAAETIEELKRGSSRILVVTGGFHTAALPYLVQQNQKPPTRQSFDREECGSWLIRYSFDRLDALNGYSAGMPSPEYYDRLYQARKAQTLPATSLAGNAHTLPAASLARNAGRGDALRRPARGTEEKSPEETVAAEILVEISRLSRERKFSALVTTPDAISAFQMSVQLAIMRGHQFPAREDLLDGIRSCFVKGELAVEGQVLLSLVREVLSGNRVGDIPPGGDLPPIVDDFYKECRRYRISVEQVERKEHALDLYRSATHRGLSRFFHRLSFLKAPFARFIDGPDFVSGQRLELMQEHWESTWSPLVESSLIESSLFGTTIEEAAAAKLELQISRLADDSQARCTSAAVEMLVRSCRLALHAQSSKLVPLIDLHIAEDSNVKSLVLGLSQLELLQKAREPLEAFNLTAIPRLMKVAYNRATGLLSELAFCPDQMVDDVLPALQALREILSSCTESGLLDQELFHAGLARIVDFSTPEAQSPVVGAAAGILHADGRLSTEELIKVVCGYMDGAMNDPRKSIGVLRGLLAVSCEVAWQVGEILKALDTQFRSWDESTFLDMLPELRLAFAALTPRDIARIAEKVSELHQGRTLGSLVHTDIDEADITWGLMLNERVTRSLRTDGLLTP